MDAPLELLEHVFVKSLPASAVTVGVFAVIDILSVSVHPLEVTVTVYVPALLIYWQEHLLRLSPGEEVFPKQKLL